MSDEIIHCRLPAGTLARLDEHVSTLRERGASIATRSSVVRILLAAQLEADQEANVSLEILLRTQQVLSRAAARALQRALAELPKALDAVAEETASATLRQLISKALHRVWSAAPVDIAKITDEVFTEPPSPRPQRQ